MRDHAGQHTTHHSSIMWRTIAGIRLNRQCLCMIRRMSPKPLWPAARDPSDEDIVGWDGTIKIAMKRFLPSAADALMARDNAQDPDGRPTRTELSRRVSSPIEEGTEVDVGRRTAR